MGNATGVVVNYAPHSAIRFDLNGVALEMLPDAFQPDSPCAAGSLGSFDASRPNWTRAGPPPGWAPIACARLPGRELLK
jgi:hypothetical protein